MPRAKSTSSVAEENWTPEILSSRAQYARNGADPVTSAVLFPPTLRCAEQDIRNGPDRQALAIGVKGAHIGLKAPYDPLHLRAKRPGSGR